MSFCSNEKNELQTKVKRECLVQFANKNKNEGFFNDVTIKAGKCCYPANRLVLSCFSPFFEKMFKSMKDYSNRTVVIQGVDELTFRNVLDFIYTGDIIINHDNVMDLLAAADYLQVKQLMEFCFELLDSSITANNCLVILSAAHIYHNDVLRSKGYQFLSENSSFVAASYDFQNLSKEELVSCIANLNKIHTKQSSVYELVITWIKYDEAVRKSELPDLLQLINLNVLPRNILEDISKESLIQENLVCANQVLAAAFYNCSKREKSVGNTCKILVFGEILTEDVSTFNCSRTYGRKVYELVLNAKTRSHWSLCEYPLDYPNLADNFFTCTCALTLNNFLYAINSSEKESSVFRLNLKNSMHKWEKLAPINLSFCMKSISVFDNSLVAAGGNNAKTFSSLAMMYDIDCNQWKMISPLIETRSNHCIIACNYCLFALGGCNSLERISLSSVERLENLNSAWHVVSPMRHKRSNFAVVSFKGFIFAIGGQTRESVKQEAVALSSVEKYDPFSDRWSFCGELNVARAYHSACVFAEKIFVLGGINEKQVKEIECYDLSSDIWSIVGRLNNNQYCYSVIST